MACYREGGCGPYEMLSCSECPASKKDYLLRQNGNKYKVVTLCGSTRFKEDFIKKQEELTLQGYIVLSVGLFGHADAKYASEITPEVKLMLDDMHKRKIDMADFIYVINRDGYIGDSTRSEIEYAISTGKPVKYMCTDNIKYRMLIDR